jgi:hypothetical protein
MMLLVCDSPKQQGVCWRALLCNEVSLQMTMYVAHI